MALNLYELKDSQAVEKTVDSANATLKWIAFYSTDRAAVYTAALLVAPLLYAGYRRQKFKLTPIGNGFWMVDVDYGFSATTQTDTPDTPTTPDDTTPIGPETTFDITAQTIHITQSLSTRYRIQAADETIKGAGLAVDAANFLKVTPDGYAPVGGDVGKIVLIVDDPVRGWVGGAYRITAVGGGQWTLDKKPAPVGTTTGRWALIAGLSISGTAENYNHAIGISRDRIEGTDIFAPHFEFTFQYQLPVLYLPYLRVIRQLCGKVNAAPFRQWAAGEVLYLGATGQPGSDGNAWSLTHKFAVGENLYAIPLSDDIIIPFKGAWEYLWVAYKNGTNAGVPVQVPRSAYVETVYRSADFGLLGIGA